MESCFLTKWNQKSWTEFHIFFTDSKKAFLPFFHTPSNLPPHPSRDRRDGLIFTLKTILDFNENPGAPGPPLTHSLTCSDRRPLCMHQHKLMAIQDQIDRHDFFLPKYHPNPGFSKFPTKQCKKFPPAETFSCLNGPLIRNWESGVRFFSFLFCWKMPHNCDRKLELFDLNIVFDFYISKKQSEVATQAVWVT